MRNITSLNSEKFKKLGLYQVTDTSKLYAGQCQATQQTYTTAQSAANGGYTSHWDSIAVGSTTAFNDDSKDLGPVTTSYMPSGIQALVQWC